MQFQDMKYSQAGFIENEFGFHLLDHELFDYFT